MKEPARELSRSDTFRRPPSASLPRIHWSLARMFRIVTACGIAFSLCRNLDSVPYPVWPADAATVLFSALAVASGFRRNGLLTATFLICTILTSATAFLHCALCQFGCDTTQIMAEEAARQAIWLSAIPIITTSLVLATARFPLRLLFAQATNWMWLGFSIAIVNLILLISLGQKFILRIS